MRPSQADGRCAGFTDEPVPREVLERVLSAAAWSPSGSNVQPWNTYVLQALLRDPLVSFWDGDFALGMGISRSSGTRASFQTTSAQPRQPAGLRPPSTTLRSAKASAYGQAPRGRSGRE